MKEQRRLGTACKGGLGERRKTGPLPEWEMIRLVPFACGWAEPLGVMMCGAHRA
ncbi:MAG: hypothetical protein IJ604_02845 [Prevotella sp.]|nr:hypothetical protein [Prevotella sp.]